ncbi:MAG: hypothetical protein Q9207_005796 [Kuettlingeria erythrocarpa]
MATPPYASLPSMHAITMADISDEIDITNNQLALLRDQVDHVIKRTSTIETQLDELATFLDGLVFPALRDSARVLAPIIAENPTFEHRFAAPAARASSSMAEIRQVVKSIRVQQQGCRDSQPFTQSPAQIIPQTRTPPAPPAQPASTARTTVATQTEQPVGETRIPINGFSTPVLSPADITPTAPATKPMATSHAENPFNPHAQDFVPAGPTPQGHSAQPSTASEPLPEIPSAEVAEAFSLAWAEAVRPLKLQTLADSKWASGHAPFAAPSPAIPEAEGAQAFRQRMASRGIVLTDPREQAAASAGRGFDISAYASLDLFEEKFRREEIEKAVAEVKEEKKGGLTANLDDLLKGYDAFKEKQSKRK